jgi:hypothetical protein
VRTRCLYTPRGNMILEWHRHLADGTWLEAHATARGGCLSRRLNGIPAREDRRLYTSGQYDLEREEVNAYGWRA